MKSSVASVNSNYSVSSRSFTQADEIREDWLELEKRSKCSYFQSWGWIGCWLDQVVNDLQPVLIEISIRDRVVAMGILVDKKIKRRGVISSSGLFLNEYPFDDRDMAIEYNGLLIDAEVADAAQIYAALISDFKTRQYRYDELFFGAVSESTVYNALLTDHDKSSRLVLEEESYSWQVDLRDAGEGIDGFLNTLSKNRRTQVRRSMRLFRDIGNLQLLEAKDSPQALEYFEGLETLHNQRWRRKGLPGSFANPVWARFHRELIGGRFETGEIQLLKVQAGDTPIGYLYNFVWRKRVYVLQTGFSINDDKRLMPGYVVHVMAIVHNRNKGFEIYDFMHGDSVYKRVLSNRSEKLCWAAVQKRRLKFVLENRLLAIYRGVKRRF